MSAARHSDTQWTSPDEVAVATLRKAIPSPREVEFLGGDVDLRGATICVSGSAEALRPVATLLTNKLAGSRRSDVAHHGRPCILLQLDHTSGDRYSMRAEGDRVVICGSTVERIADGAKTLCQLVDASADTTIPALWIADEPAYPYRAAHLDFRSHCLMPKFPYLLRTIELLASYKINIALVEWEDKFPYRGHPEIASREALSETQIERLLDVAAAVDVEIVPLVQTLGHVEYVLKHERFAELRERKDDISQLCPSNPGSLELVIELVNEVLAAHPTARFIHLGGDETWLLGSCAACAAKAGTRGPLALYAEHMSALCQHVLDAGKKPLIWADVLIGKHAQAGVEHTAEDIAAIGSLPHETRLVYWEYRATRSQEFDGFNDVLALGLPTWVAPTTRVSNLVPDYATHLPNISALLETGIANAAEGACLTSWAWKNQPFELTWHGMIVAAERAWSGSGAPQEELDRRAAASYFGADVPEFVEALYVLSYDYWAQPHTDADGVPIWSSMLSRNPGYEYTIPNPSEVRRRAMRAGRLLVTATARACRHIDTLETWTVAAQLVAHSATKQLLFDDMEELLNDPMRQLDERSLKRLRTALERLNRNRQKLEVVWRTALERTHVRSSVDVDNVLRFGGERAYTQYALEQLRALQSAEGRRIWR